MEKDKEKGGIENWKLSTSVQLLMYGTIVILW